MKSHWFHVPMLDFHSMKRIIRRRLSPCDCACMSLHSIFMKICRFLIWPNRHECMLIFLKKWYLSMVRHIKNLIFTRENEILTSSHSRKILCQVLRCISAHGVFKKSFQNSSYDAIASLGVQSCSEDELLGNKNKAPTPTLEKQ